MHKTQLLLLGVLIGLINAVIGYQFLGYQFADYPPRFYQDTEADISFYVALSSSDASLRVNGQSPLLIDSQNFLFYAQTTESPGYKNLTVVVTENSVDSDLVVVHNYYVVLGAPTVSLTLYNNNSLNFDISPYYEDRLYFKLSGMQGKSFNSFGDSVGCNLSNGNECRVYQLGLSEYYYADLTAYQGQQQDYVTVSTDSQTFKLYFSTYYQKTIYTLSVPTPTFLGNWPVYYAFMAYPTEFTALAQNPNSNYPVYLAGNYSSQLNYISQIPSYGQSLGVDIFQVSTTPTLGPPLGAYTGAAYSYIPLNVIVPSIPAPNSLDPLVLNLVVNMSTNDLSFFRYNSFCQYTNSNVLITSVLFEYPFGLGNMDLNTSPQYDISLFLSRFQGAAFYDGCLGTAFPTWSVSDQDLTPPLLTKASLVHFQNNIYTLTIQCSDEQSGCRSFSIPTIDATLGLPDLILGDVNFGTFQKNIFIPNEYQVLDIWVTDYALNLDIIPNGRVLSPTDMSNFTPVNPFIYFSNRVTGVRFANYLNNSGTLYVKIESPNLYSAYSPIFTVYTNSLKNEQLRPSTVFYGLFDQTLGEFVVPFTIPKNMNAGDLFYDIGLTGTTYPSKLLVSMFGQSARFIIQNQVSMEIGLLVSSISASTGVWTDASVPLTLSYTFALATPLVNGFDSGVVMMGSVNPYQFRSEYLPLVFNSSDNTLSVSWNVLILSCVNRDVYILHLKLQDQAGLVSEYYRDGVMQSEFFYFNPLAYLAPDEDKIQIQCYSGLSISSVTLSAFTLTYNSAAITSSTIIPVNGPFTLHLDYTLNCPSGLSGEVPSLYAMEAGMNMVSFPVAYNLTNSQTGNYSGDIQFPKGFGGNEGIIFSLYGLSNAQFRHFGYSATYMSSVLPASTSYVRTSFSAITDRFQIDNYTLSTPQGGLLTIRGGNFQIFANDNLRAQYSPDFITYQPAPIVSATLNTMVISVLNLRPDKTRFSLLVSRNSSPNQINTTIFYVPINTPSPTVSKPCPGQPICGGSSNGVCTASGCQCIAPWVGTDCSSKLLSPTPNITTVSPQLNIQLNSSNNGNNYIKSNQVFKNDIGLVSLDEYDIFGGLVKSYPLDTASWNYENFPQSDFTEYRYTTNISKTSDLITALNVSIRVYNSDSTVYFASQAIPVAKATIKYQIYITNYEFGSTTNKLTFVFKASISSNTNDSCSVQSTGTTSDDFEYIKLQIDNYSLYAQLIKRAEVDYRVVSISNSLLDKSESTSSSTQLIGVNVPYYNTYALLDPDFSLLLDYREASDYAESVCDSVPVKKGLTTAQLAGIIIGSVVGGLFIILVITYFVLKRFRYSKALLHLRGKTLSKL